MLFVRIMTTDFHNQNSDNLIINIINNPIVR